jgi:hypothetical protein
MARALDVRVMALCRLIFDVRHSDRNTAFALFGRVINAVEGSHRGKPLLPEHHRNGGGKRRLPVIDVTDRADVDVRFRSVEFFLCHVSTLLLFLVYLLN